MLSENTDRPYSEYREGLIETYGEDIVLRADGIMKRKNLFNLARTCDYIWEWEQITEKLIRMYGHQLAGITLWPISGSEG